MEESIRSKRPQAGTRWRRDPPLAGLFVHVAKQPDVNAEGTDRARSAPEAFLYRRLETLPETARRFRLSTSLSAKPIFCS